MEFSEIYTLIKKSFCELTSFKQRNNILEVVTAFSTVNNKFVSVFIKIENDKIIITDGGWIEQNYYENPIYEDSEDVIKKVTDSFLHSYNVKVTYDGSGEIFYYKSATDFSKIPSHVFDMANFIVGLVNANCIQYKDEKEEKERETFRADANGFLRVNYEGAVKFREGLDDFKRIKFNAVVYRGANIYLITYITGSTPYYFENELRKTIVNFEISERSKMNPLIKERISIINNNSDGYQPEKSSSIFELLREKSTREPIKWTEKEKLLEIV